MTAVAAPVHSAVVNRDREDDLLSNMPEPPIRNDEPTPPGPFAETAASGSAPPAPAPSGSPPPLPPVGRRAVNATIRVFAVTYILVAVMAVALFFSPWVNHQFPGSGSVEQSGAQIASGTVDYRARHDRSPRDRAEYLLQRSHKRPGALTAVWLYLVGLLLVAGAGTVHAIIGGSRRPLLPMFGSGMAAAVLIVLFSIPLPLEQRIEITGSRTAGFVLACVLTFLCLAAAIAHYTLAVVRQRIAAETSSSNS